MVKSKTPSAPQEVTIFRSGYASDELWSEAIRLAVLHGHQVMAITGDGKVVALSKAGAEKEVLE